MLNYPITLTPDSNGTYLVGFPDLPEANSVGDDLEDALRNAVASNPCAFGACLRPVRRCIPIAGRCEAAKLEPGLR